MARIEKINLDEIEILPWIEKLIPARTDEEQRFLKEDIEKNGVRTNLIITKIDGKKNVLIDGHGRYKALQEIDDGKPVKCERREYKDDQAIKDEMLRIQLGRRNLDENTKSRLRAKIWEQAKKERRSSKKEVAKDLGVTERTLTKDMKFADAANTLETVLPNSNGLIADPTTPKTVINELAETAKEDPEIAQDLVLAVSKGRTKDEKSKILKEKKERRSSKKEVATATTEKKPKTKSIQIGSSLVARLKVVAESFQPPMEISELVEQYIKEGLDNEKHN